MRNDTSSGRENSGTRVLTREEAKQKREYYLALAAKNALYEDQAADESDPTEATMATLILPGG